MKFCNSLAEIFAKMSQAECREYPPWSNRDNQQLREMFLSGIPVDELAAYFEHSENSIRARLFYMGLTRESPLPPWRKKS